MPDETVILHRADLVARLRKVEQELITLRPAPRVELDLEATITMVKLCLQVALLS